MLDEAERVIGTPAMNLSLMIFVWRAIPAALCIGQPGRARRYADLVTQRFAAEPQPLAALLAEVGRALADWAEGGRSSELERRLEVQRARLGAAELQPTIEWFDHTRAAAASG